MSEIKRYEPINIDGTCGLCAEDPDGAYVDYCHFAALQAELRRLCSERDTLRSQLAAIQGGMGEAVGFDRNAAYAACPESGCDWGSFYVGWKAAAAQHQRIVAALSAQLRDANNLADQWAEKIAALSAQQSAPDRVSVPVDRIKIALEAVQNAMEDAYNNAYQNCCGRGIGQCCGGPEPAWSDADQAIMDALAPAQRELSALLASHAEGGKV